jgi:nucleoside 2-deoxyribosyltransferase
MKQTIYLAGPINACSDSECNEWRTTAKVILSDKYDILDPMVRDYRDTCLDDYKYIVESDLDDVKKADIVLANCYKPSAGTSMELVYASQMGKKVYSASSPSPWVKYHSDKTFEHINDAIEYLLNIKEGN